MRTLTDAEILEECRVADGMRAYAALLDWPQAAICLLDGANQIYRLKALVEWLQGELADERELFRIMSLTPDEVIAETIADGLDPDQVVKDGRAIVERAIASVEFKRGAEAMRGAAAKVADERKILSFDAAAKYTDPIMARSEQCAGIEAQYIADTIRALPLPAPKEG